jgi:Bacterial lectin/Secretion system C-terminal sorting domain
MAIPFLRNIIYLLALLFFTLLSSQSQAQCSGGSAAGALTPAPAIGWQTIGITTGNYYTFVVAPVTGCSYPTFYFSFCAGDGGSAGFDTQITILDNTGAYAGGYSDDACGLQSFVAWTPTAAGTYRVLLNTYFCGTGSGATLAYRMQPASATDPYYSLVESATTSGPGCVTLTSATNGLRGCAWDLDETLNFLAPFSRDFTVNLGSNPAGADGISFVIQNSPAGRCACGLPGGSLGSAGIPSSLIFEIDTYLNAEDRDDGMATVLCGGGPEPDHLDIWINGNINPAGGGCPAPPGARIIPAAVRLMTGGFDYEVENGLNHTFRITWVPGAPGTITATLWNVPAVTLYGTVSYSFDPLTLFGTNTPFFGFTASTGGLNNQQSFCGPIVLDQNEIVLDGVSSGEEVSLHWNAPTGYVFAEIDRSDNQSDWATILAIQTQLNVSQQSASDPDFIHGKGWYRVRMQTTDGQMKTSNVIEVVNEIRDGIRVFPNPAQDRIQIELPGDLASGVVRIYSVTGQVVSFLPFETDCGVAKVDVTSVPAGLYFVEVVDGVGKVAGVGKVVVE